MKGGSLTVREIKSFLESSYMPEAPDEVMGYKLDNDLSNLYGKVYVNEALKKIILAFRGTGMENLGTDWLNNYTFLLNSTSYKLTPRYQTALKMYDKAMKKYKNYKFNLLGHSQSGVIVNNLCSDKVQNCISLNPAYKNASLKNNEFIIRSSGDVVSQMAAPKKFMNSILYPSWTANHMRTIENTTGNPLKEHAIDILDRLDPNMAIGRGGNLKKESKQCKCEKKRQLNGYSLNVCLSKV
jgi:hypothetical protein